MKSVVVHERGLDDKSRVPLAWVFAILSCSGSALLVAVGVGLYTGKIEAQGKTNGEAIQDLKKEAIDRDGILWSIDERLSRIEGALSLPRGRHVNLKSKNKGESKNE